MFARAIEVTGAIMVVLMGVVALATGVAFIYSSLEGAGMLPELMLRHGVEYTAAGAVCMLLLGQFCLFLSVYLFWIAKEELE